MKIISGIKHWSMHNVHKIFLGVVLGCVHVLALDLCPARFRSFLVWSSASQEALSSQWWWLFQKIAYCPMQIPSLFISYVPSTRRSVEWLLKNYERKVQTQRAWHLYRNNNVHCKPFNYTWFAWVCLLLSWPHVGWAFPNAMRSFKESILIVSFVLDLFFCVSS